MIKQFVIATLLGAVLAAGAMAAQKPAKPTADAPKVVTTCPVMKGSAPTNAGGESTYHGHTYYFCCGGCKPKFDKDPTRYVCPVSGHVLPKKPTVTTTYKEKEYFFCSADCKARFLKDPEKYLKP